jgi:hypothetical protein
VARNAFALALLAALALGGCSQIKGLLPGGKEEKAQEAKLAALRARTDSLRKARRVADSLAQIRFVACSDSVRAELTKPAAVKGKKTRRKRKFVPPSEATIVTQVQTMCSTGGAAPQPTVAAADTASAKPAAADTSRVAAAAPAQAAVPAPAPVASTTPADASTGQPSDTVSADSAKKAKEMEMTRETFAYSGASRDPFNSLLNMAKNGPELADLQLVGIYQNLRAPDASIAVFREKDGGKRHKLRAGDQVGRSRLVQIRDRHVVFMIEDFGFERQETLSLRKQEDVTP